MLDAIAVACVVLAAFFVLKRFLGSKKSSCGCGSSSGCQANKKQNCQGGEPKKEDQSCACSQSE